MELSHDILENPVMAIETSTDTRYEIDLTNELGIHQCNEFLRSLGLGNHIQFVTYPQYYHTISHAVCLLQIKRLMKEIGYTGSLTAYEVYSVMLDDLSDKYNCNVTREYANNLTPYIKEALSLLGVEQKVLA
jgi:hypothetical protein